MKLFISTALVLMSMSSFAHAKQPVAKPVSLVCGSVDDAIETMRNAGRAAITGDAKKAQLTLKQSMQALSALISYKLENEKLSDQERQALQEEHEGACSEL